MKDKKKRKNIENRMDEKRKNREMGSKEGNGNKKS